MSVNSVVLIGRLAKEPELKNTPAGKSVANFTLAVGRNTAESTADFINCVAWNQSADFITSYAHKGDGIAVEGNIRTRSYDDQMTGKKVWVTEVVANRLEITAKKAGNTLNDNSYTDNRNTAKSNDFDAGTRNYVAEDDLPF